MGLLGPLEEFWRLMDPVLAPQRHPNTDASVKQRFRKQETVGVALVMKPNTSRLDQRGMQAYLEPLLQKAKWPQV